MAAHLQAHWCRCWKWQRRNYPLKINCIKSIFVECLHFLCYIRQMSACFNLKLKKFAYPDTKEGAMNIDNLPTFILSTKENSHNISRWQKSGKIRKITANIYTSNISNSYHLSRNLLIYFHILLAFNYILLISLYLFHNQNFSFFIKQ